MYKIIGGNQKQYGPVPAEDVRQWIQERRLQGNSLIQLAGTTDWKPLSLFPEFSSALAESFPASAPATATAAFMKPMREEKGNTMAVAGLISSCLALLCCGCFPFAVLGLVLSFIGLSQAKCDPAQSGRPIAIAGIVIGFIALLGNIALFALGALGNLLEALGRR